MSDALEGEESRETVNGREALVFPSEDYELQPVGLSLLNPIPCDLDTKIRDVCGAFAQLRGKERRAFSATLSTGDFGTLCHFAMRSAVFALRDLNARPLKQGLIALAMIEKERYPMISQILNALRILYHTAPRLAEDPEQHFRVAADLAEPKMAKLIIDYTQQETKGENRNVGLFFEVVTELGSGFAEKPRDQDERKSDLLSIALEVAAMIEQDRFKTFVIKVGRTPLDWWWEDADPKTLEEALQRVREGSLIEARPYPIISEEDTRRVLIVNLMELEDSESARYLFDFSRPKKEPKPGWFALAVDRLFCLSYIGSYHFRVKADEPYDLGWLKTGIEKAMREGAQPSASPKKDYS